VELILTIDQEEETWRKERNSVNSAFERYNSFHCPNEWTPKIRNKYEESIYQGMWSVDLGHSQVWKSNALDY
jgi:hypothetical protein